MRFYFYLLVSFFLAFPHIVHGGLDFGELKATPMMVTGIYLVDKESVPISFGQSAELEARTFPDGQPVTWLIQPDTDSKAEVKYSESGNSVTITATNESGSGWVVVEASLLGGTPVTAKVYVGCATCANGSCDVVGNGTVNIGSIDIRISLGKAEEGMPAGDLFIKTDKPSAEIFTPRSLQLSTLSENVSQIKRDGVLKQIRTPQSLIIIEPASSQSYEIVFYSKEDVAGEENGLYQVKSSAEPISVWRLENPDASGASINKLIVTEYRLGSERRYEYSYTDEDNTWSLASGNGLRLETRKEYIDSNGNRVERTIISGNDGIPVSVTENVYRSFDWGEELIAEITDPDGDRLTTTYKYYENNGNGYSKLASRVDHAGSWVRYEYDFEDRRIKTITPFLDSSIDVDESKAQVTITDYKPLPGDAADKADNHKPRTVTTLITGIVTSKTFYHYSTNSALERVEISEQCSKQQCSFGDETNLRSTTTYYAKSKRPRSKKVKSHLGSDGRLARYLYEAGTFTLNSNPEKAQFTVGEGTAVLKTTIQATADHPEGIPFQTTKETSITDWLGNDVMQEQYVKTEDSYERISWSYNSFDNLGRVIETLQSNGTRAETGWSCCGKASSTDSTGITTRYGYDDLKRTTVRLNEATGLTSEYSYDAAGRQLSSTDKNGELSRTRTNLYDLSGRLLESTDPSARVIRYFYDGAKTTVIRPGGAEETTLNYPDGKIRSVTGSGVVDRFYNYGVNPDGSQWTTAFIAKNNGPRWEKTTRDLLGRIIRTEKPGYSTIQASTNIYDHSGRLIKTSTTGQPDTFYQYDELGRQFRSGLDTNNNGRLDLASMDRVRENTSSYRKIEGDWWQEQKNIVYAKDNSDIPTTLATTRTRLSGWQDRLIDEQIAIDINGNETINRERLNRYDRERIRTTTSPDSKIPATQFYKNNLLIASVSKTGLKTTFGYDALGRRIATTDPRTGTATTHYNDLHQIDYIEDATGNRTGFSYEPDTGLKTIETNPMGKKTFYDYTLHGQLARTWGEVPYPVEYGYNDYGEMVEMYTFRSKQTWKEQQWPEDANGDKTSWEYHDATGMLLMKRDAKGFGASYSYDKAGRLASRTWARDITTTYSYQPSGELGTIDYSDDTADIGFSYDRLGRKKTVSDALGRRSFSYNGFLQLEAEKIGGATATTIKRSYDEQGRNSGFSLNEDYRISYSFDKKGRFSGLNWQAQNTTGSTSYSYLENSDLLSGYTSGSNVTTYEYEPHRNLKTAVNNTSHDSLISRYEYQYDRLGRRTNVSNRGSAFSENAFTVYGYNNRNEVQTSSRFLGSDLTDQTKPVSSEERFYNYDPIGNRTISLEAEQQREYQSNGLNQYGQIQNSKGTDLTYDQDGNLTKLSSDTDTLRYVYNGENRLISVEPIRPQKNATRSIYSYDYMGRRVEKKVFSFLAEEWQLTTHSSFIYDGWNLIAETNNINDKVTNYIWGLDLSHSLQGAGGIGGLVARVDGGNTHSYFYDANGNVGQLIDAEGSLVAAYEYDPFGKAIVTLGDIVENNPFRFSTKYFDGDSGLYYYGYRYYSPQLGRWFNSDPIEEEGGYNLYGFVANNGINDTDFIGLEYGVLITDRRVSGLLGAAYHYALEKWENCLPSKDTEISISEWVNKNPNTNQLDKIELLNTSGNKAWEYRMLLSAGNVKKFGWVYVNVGISVINYGYNSNSKSTKAKLIFSAEKSSDVDNKWREIKRLAQSYEYAEQQGYNGSFRKFPKSVYRALGNNSNTFIRYLVNNSGLIMSEMKKFHQGNDSLDLSHDYNQEYANPNQENNKPNWILIQ